MTVYQIDLNEFPMDLHRSVRAWYFWQVIYLRKFGEAPGSSQKVLYLPHSDVDQYWGGLVPRMISENELMISDDGEISYSLIKNDDGSRSLYKRDRSTRSEESRFFIFEDAEKYLLFLISQLSRPGKYTESPDYLWYKEGLVSEVSMRPVNPELEYPQQFYYSSNGADRGWMGESTAISFSHAVVINYEELELVLREGVPSDWFDFELIEI